MRPTFDAVQTLANAIIDARRASALSGILRLERLIRSTIEEGTVVAYLTETAVRSRASRAMGSLRKSMRDVSTETAVANATFDVFLSHSSNEPDDIMLGVLKFLEDLRLSVYVDNYSDPQTLKISRWKPRRS